MKKRNLRWYDQSLYGVVHLCEFKDGWNIKQTWGQVHFNHILQPNICAAHLWTKVFNHWRGVSGRWHCWSLASPSRDKPGRGWQAHNRQGLPLSATIFPSLLSLSHVPLPPWSLLRRQREADQRQSVVQAQGFWGRPWPALRSPLRCVNVHVGLPTSRHVCMFGGHLDWDRLSWLCWNRLFPLIPRSQTGCRGDFSPALESMALPLFPSVRVTRQPANAELLILLPKASSPNRSKSVRRGWSVANEVNRILSSGQEAGSCVPAKSAWLCYCREGASGLQRESMRKSDTVCLFTEEDSDCSPNKPHLPANLP